MRILIVSSFLPYPLHSGGHVRLYNLMKQLAAHHTLTLVCEKRSYQTDKDIAEVKKMCKEVYCVDRKKQWSFENVAKTSFSPYPFLLVGHTLPFMKRKLVELLREETFDIIHVETFYVMQNVPKTYLPLVLAEHNIEYQVYGKYVKVAPLPLRPLLLTDIRKIKYWERKFWKKATKLIAVSEADKHIMKRDDAIVVANGVDLKDFKFQIANSKCQMKEKHILFMGDFKWLQNREAANEILDKIWPEVKKAMKEKKMQTDIKLWIVGKHIPEDIRAMHGGDIMIDENAPDDTAKIYKRAYMLLAPIRVGGGTSYKILEAMASGVPVVTTELGVVGLGARHKKEALVGDSPQSMAHHVVSLLSEKGEYETITINARKLIEEKYPWDTIAKELEKVYREATIT